MRNKEEIQKEINDSTTNTINEEPNFFPEGT